VTSEESACLPGCLQASLSEDGTEARVQRPNFSHLKPQAKPTDTEDEKSL